MTNLKWLSPKDIYLHYLNGEATWASVCRKAGLVEQIPNGERRPSAHTQTQTTARYAHLCDDSLHEAAEKVGAVVTLQRQENEVLPDRSLQ